LKVSTNVKIAMQCFENFGGGYMAQMSPPLVARLPITQDSQYLSQEIRCKNCF